MPMKEFILGAAVRVRGTFRHPLTGVVFDPATVKISYRHASGAVTTKTFGIDVEVVKESIGVYYLDIDVNAVGLWHWRVFSQGAGQTADEGTFRVPASNF